MVSQALVQSKANYGFARAAAALGAANAWYRPSDATAPIVSGNLRGAVTVLYDTSADLKQRQPSKREKPEDWFAAFDRTGVQVGDYLVDPELGTFFIASLEHFRPARVVRCNRVVGIAHPQPQPVGDSYYGGDQTGAAVPVLTGWPAALLNGTKGERSVTNLPGDVRAPWVNILLPASAGISIAYGDVLTDDLGRAYTLSACELTAEGWRLTGSYSGT
jgi:hypothetical protein